MYKRQTHTVNGLSAEMDQIAKWEKELGGMRGSKNCGILEVESRKLKTAMQPLISDKMVALKGRRPDMPSTCPPVLADIIRRMWVEKSGERPSFEVVIKYLENSENKLRLHYQQHEEPDSNVGSTGQVV